MTRHRTSALSVSICVGRLLALALTVGAGAAQAIDVPLFGKSLVVRRKANGKETLTFTALGATLPLPMPATSGDPLTSSVAGAFIDLVSTGSSAVGAFVAPAGPGGLIEAGWKRSASGATLTYKNRLAPGGESVVRTLVLKQGKKLKLVGTRAGLRLEGAEGTVGIRVTIGKGTPNEIRLCSQFGPGRVVRDVTGDYTARNSPPTPALVDCSDTTLGTHPTLTEAIPLDTASCGPTFDGPGQSIAFGTDLHRVTLHGANEVCNDGSPAVFYIRPANAGTGHTDDWLIWLEGGGNCGSPESCADRWCGVGSQPGYGAHKMSSRYTLWSIKGNGAFSQDPDNDFRDFNMVQTYYCSSDNYVGRDSLDVEPVAGYPGYKLQFNGQAILQGIWQRLRIGVTSDDGQVSLPPLGRTSNVLFTGTSGGGQGATYNTNRVGEWAASIPVAKFRVSIDARTGPMADDTTSLSDTEKETGLARGATIARFRNDVVDEYCAAFHALDDVRLCTDSAHVLLHHVRPLFFINQDVEDPVIGYEPYEDMEAFSTAVRISLSTQFRQRDTVAEEAAVRALPLPAVFAARCNQHVYLESAAFFRNEVSIPPAAYSDYSDNLWIWWTGGTPPTLIDGVAGAQTDTANCF